MATPYYTIAYTGFGAAPDQQYDQIAARIEAWDRRDGSTRYRVTLSHVQGCDQGSAGRGVWHRDDATGTANDLTAACETALSIAADKGFRMGDARQAVADACGAIKEDDDAPDTTLARIGEALFGSQWQTDLARALGVSSRQVRRWAKGRPIPTGAQDDLRGLMAERREMLGALDKSL